MTRLLVASVALVAAQLTGCHRGDPADRMIARMDSIPPQERPKNWAHTRALMTRPAPNVGEPAPDFTLKTLDGDRSVTLSEYARGKPKLLIFGSYT